MLALIRMYLASCFQVLHLLYHYNTYVAYSILHSEVPATNYVCMSKQKSAESLQEN